MIPSPTKLALLTGLVLLAGEASAHPTRYDQRQEGDFNLRADVEDVLFVAVPPREYITNGFTWLETNIIRQSHGGPNRIPTRTPSKFGFVPSEKSPYKVDLGKSTIPLTKLQTTAAAEDVKVRDATEATQPATPSSTPTPTAEVTTTSESKTVKKDLRDETDGEEQVTAAEATSVKPVETVKRAEETTKKAETTTKKAETTTKKTETTTKKADSKDKGSGLVLVGDGSDPTSNTRVEGCGPDAHRDGSGKCVYERKR